MLLKHVRTGFRYPYWGTRTGIKLAPTRRRHAVAPPVKGIPDQVSSAEFQLPKFVRILLAIGQRDRVERMAHFHHCVQSGIIMVERGKDGSRVLHVACASCVMPNFKENVWRCAAYVTCAHEVVRRPSGHACKQT